MTPITNNMIPRTETDCEQMWTLPPHFPEDCIVSLFFVAGVDISSSAS